MLHLEDMVLTSQGHLPLSALVTLRVGELAYDPLTERLLPLEAEAIKVVGTGAADAPWHCIFHSGDSLCDLYTHRPAQCRALFCMDSTGLQAIYRHNRATRRDVLRLPHSGWNVGDQPPHVLNELAEAHEEQCPLKPLIYLIQEVRSVQDDPDAVTAVLEAVRFDVAFREIAMERGAIPANILPFLLGRPLTVFLRSVGLSVITLQGSDILTLQHVGPSHYPAPTPPAR